MSENNNKSSGIIKLLKGVGAVAVTILGTVASAEGAHKISEANQRKKAMDTALKENNKNN